MSNTPAYLQDAKSLLSNTGFACNSVWYHGTSSALTDSITSNGLKRSGDKSMKQAAKQTMATIGNNYTESIEPVFLTQSKEIALYWANQTVRNRSVRGESEETPVVIAVTLSDEINTKVKPDVGAASLLLLPEGEHFMAHLGQIYQQCGIDGPDIDLMNADRLEYLNKLGFAYLNQDIDAACLSVITE
jgi:hypothetical protein